MEHEADHNNHENRPVKTLYIDDNPHDQQLVQHALAQDSTNFDLTLVSNRDEFETILTTEDWDLVLSDFNILGFDGLQVLEYTKSKLPHLPIIIVTGTGSETIAVQAMQAGASDYVIKTPDHIRALPFTIGKVLEHHQAQAKHRDTIHALKRSETRFREMFLKSSIAKALTNLDGSLQTVNDAFCDLVGYGREELEKLSFSDLTHPEDVALSLDFMEKMANGTIPKARFHKRYIHKDDRTIWGDVNVILLKDENEKPSVFLTGIVDITEQVKQKQSLREQECKYRLLADNTLDAIWQMDPDLIFTYINPAVEQIFGYTQEEWIGSALSDHCRSEQMAYMASVIQQEMANTERHTGLVLETVMLRKDGSEIPVEVHGKLLIDDAGTILGLQGTTRDIRSRKEAAEKKLFMEKELQQAQKMEAVGRLAGGVAHDFNNMLNVILGYAGIALSKSEPDSPITYHLQEIEKAALRSADLTRQLLAFSRKQAIEPRKLNLNAAIGEQIKMLKRLIGEDITIRFEPEDSIWDVWMDPGQVSQILANLAVNARDSIDGTGTITIKTEHHAPTGATVCPVCVKEMPAGEYVTLSFSDTGHGIDAEIRDRIFEPFFTTKAEGEGTGLGLATVYGIMVQNEGHIHVISEPGEGTTFHLCFPKCIQDQMDASKSSPDQVNLEGHEIILVVEDEPQVLSIAERGLQMYGYNVLTASSAAEAIGLLKQGTKIDLLITDVVMPDMNGKELEQKAREMVPGLRVVFMSGYTADVIAKRGIIENEMTFISKPFSIEDLVRTVRRKLDE